LKPSVGGSGTISRRGGRSNPLKALGDPLTDPGILRGMSHLISPKTCFVAHFDVLGIRTLIARSGSTAWSLMRDLFEIRGESLEISVMLAVSGRVVQDRVEHLAFSDTVFFHTPTASEEDLCAITMTAARFLAGAGAKGIPVRGGLACGEVYLDGHIQVFTGRAVLDAVQAGESANWLGVVATDEVASIASSVPLRFFDRRPLFRPWNIPLAKGESYPGFAMDWPYLFLKPKESFPTTPEQFYKVFSKTFGPYCDLVPEVRTKYENTTLFINDCIVGRAV
jgi:hypothetical protein